MGLYGTETRIITGIGFVTYWIKGCDPTYGNVTSPVIDDTIPPVIYYPKVEPALVTTKSNTTLIAVVVTIFVVLILITLIIGIVYWCRRN
jgi:hypothetical protein